MTILTLLCTYGFLPHTAIASFANDDASLAQRGSAFSTFTPTHTAQSSAIMIDTSAPQFSGYQSFGSSNSSSEEDGHKGEDLLDDQPNNCRQRCCSCCRSDLCCGASVFAGTIIGLAGICLLVIKYGF